MQQNLQTSLQNVQALATEPSKSSDANSVFCSVLDGLNTIVDNGFFGLPGLDSFTTTVDNLDLDKYFGRWYQVRAVFYAFTSTCTWWLPDLSCRMCV